VPLPIAGRDLDLAAARRVLAARLEARLAVFAKEAGGAGASPKEPPPAIVPILSTLRGEVATEDRDGFYHRSERDCSDGEIIGLDDMGRLCNVGLRYGEVVVQGEHALWDDFSDVLIAALQRFVFEVQELHRQA
jgi:hypothetical protein